VDGKVGRGRSRKTWHERVRGDLKDFGLKVKDTGNKYTWRAEVFGKTSEPCKQGKRTLNSDDDDDDVTSHCKPKRVKLVPLCTNHRHIVLNVLIKYTNLKVTY